MSKCCCLAPTGAPLVVVEGWAEFHGPGEDDVETGYDVHPVVALRPTPRGGVQALILDVDFGIIPYDDRRRHVITYVSELVQCDPRDEERITPVAERLIKAAAKRVRERERAEPALSH